MASAGARRTKTTDDDAGGDTPIPAEGPDDFNTQYQYSAISGTSLRNCYAIGYRTPFEEPFSPLALESWVIQSVEDEFNFLFGTENWLTGLWLATGGPLYVAASRTATARCGGARI